MNKSEILAQFSFFNELPSRWQQLVGEKAASASLPAGAFYFHEGDACTHIALVGKGDIRVYKGSESGREITLYHVRTGSTCILTASCVLAGMSYPASARVEAAAEAVLFPASDFRQWITESAEIRQFVFETLARRMADVMALIDEITFRKMDARLATFLQQRFANDGRPLTTLHFTHEQIAIELGSAREVISRLLKEFERLGAISITRGRIKLNDSKALERLV
ncbi:MAG: Crp/Fnr family transcriptional regulator [Deferribacteres bacterium]|nr:Crp/Fnr family transcriptional regulator [candidate division KSB1 bacterium]MCB9508827.1 Crp/Fnr family transcriptional regulator [Deferribacteres bacterium]